MSLKKLKKLMQKCFQSSAFWSKKCSNFEFCPKYWIV